MAFRNWALHDDHAMEQVRKTDEMRLAFIRNQFRKGGYRDQDLENRARLFYHYELADPMVFAEQSEERQDPPYRGVACTRMRRNRVQRPALLQAIRHRSVACARVCRKTQLPYLPACRRVRRMPGPATGIPYQGIGNLRPVSRAAVDDDKRTIDLPVDENWQISAVYGRFREDHSRGWSVGATPALFGDSKVDQTSQGVRSAGEFDKYYILFPGGHYRFCTAG